MCRSLDTRQVVARHPNACVRYVRSDDPLVRLENRRRALRRARGDHIAILGDDDGLVPHALAEADAPIRSTGTRALRCALADPSPSTGPTRPVLPLTIVCFERARDPIPTPGDISAITSRLC
jgi:hypothetical protein